MLTHFKEAEVRRRKENGGAAVWRKEDAMHIGS